MGVEYKYEPFSIYMRFYVYAIHGYVTEVMFTAIWDFVVNLNWKFHGVTSIWSVPVYGLCGLVLEQLVIRMRDRVPFLVRILIYTLWTYIWEFATGFILKQFDACPWDYTAFEGDFMGLITLEYGPAWFLGNIICEKVIIRCTKSLYWGPEHVPENRTETISNGRIDHADLKKSL